MHWQGVVSADPDAMLASWCGEAVSSLACPFSKSTVETKQVDRNHD
jgi:hypothetical protein